MLDIKLFILKRQYFYIDLIYYQFYLSLSVLVWPGGLDHPARSLTGGYLIKSALN